MISQLDREFASKVPSGVSWRPGKRRLCKWTSCRRFRRGSVDVGKVLYVQAELCVLSVIGTALCGPFLGREEMEK